VVKPTFGEGIQAKTGKWNRWGIVEVLKQGKKGDQVMEKAGSEKEKLSSV